MDLDTTANLEDIETPKDRERKHRSFVPSDLDKIEPTFKARRVARINKDWESLSTYPQISSVLIKLYNHSYNNLKANHHKFKAIQFKSKLEAFSKAGNESEAFDLIYKELDDYLLEKQFELVDNILSTIDVSQVENVYLIGILTITKPWHSNLPSRKSLYRKIASLINKSYPKSEAKQILQGLQ